jgi:hypothetical protein
MPETEENRVQQALEALALRRECLVFGRDPMTPPIWPGSRRWRATPIQKKLSGLGVEIARERHTARRRTTAPALRRRSGAPPSSGGEGRGAARGAWPT